MSVLGTALSFIAWFLAIIGGASLIRAGEGKESAGLLALFMSLAIWLLALWIIAP